MATYEKLPSDEYGSYSWLRREIGGFLGLGYNPAAWDNETANKVDSILNSGVQQFYYPPPLPVGDKGEVLPHRWSFLTPVAEMTLTVSQAEYTLPDDFAGVIEDGGFTVG